MVEVTEVFRGGKGSTWGPVSEYEGATEVRNNGVCEGVGKDLPGHVPLWSNLFVKSRSVPGLLT